MVPDSAFDMSPLNKAGIFYVSAFFPAGNGGVIWPLFPSDGLG